MQSFFRKCARGHATIHKSEIFGPTAVFRNGRGRLTINGNPVHSKQINLPEGLLIPRGKTSATGNHRKKPHTIQI